MSFPEARVSLRWWCWFVDISLVDFITVSEIVRVWFHLGDSMVVCWTKSMTKILRISVTRCMYPCDRTTLSWCPAWWLRFSDLRFLMCYWLIAGLLTVSFASSASSLAPDVDRVTTEPPGFVFIQTAMRVLGHLTFVISRKQIVRFILLIEWWYKNEKNANFVISWLKQLSYKYCV